MIDDKFIFCGLSTFIDMVNVSRSAQIIYYDDQFYVDEWPKQLAVYNNNLQTLIDSDSRLKEFLASHRSYQLDQLLYSSGKSNSENFFIYLSLRQSSVQQRTIYSWFFQYDLFSAEAVLQMKPVLKWFSANFLTEIKEFEARQTIKIVLYYFANIFGNPMALKKYLYFKFFLEKI